MAVESSSYMAWWPLPAWIIPGGAAAWFYFILLNVLVGAIAVTSSRAELQSRRRRLCRSASSMVLERLRSFSVFNVQRPTEDQSWYYTSPEEDKVQVSEGVQEPVAVPVAAASPDELVATEDGMEAEETTVTGSDEKEELGLQSRAVPVPESTSSPPQPAPAAAVAVATTEGSTSPVRRGPAKVAGLANNAKAKRRRSQAYADADGKAELNARAEQFITQFRQELRLQRLNSVLGTAARR